MWPRPSSPVWAETSLFSHLLLLGHFYLVLLSLTMYLKYVKLNPEFLYVFDCGGRTGVLSPLAHFQKRSTLLGENTTLPFLLHYIGN